MGFAAGPVSFQRFTIAGPLPASGSESFFKKLAQRGMGTTPPQTDGTQFGWAGPRHLLDADLTPENVAFGDYVNLALRVDALKTPAPVLRAYQQLEEDALRTAGGRDFLSKTDRRRAREAARERADQEAKAGAFRRMSASPVLFDLAQREVYLGSLGASSADRLMALFGDTFGASLEPVTPETLAGRVLQRARRTREYEQLTPFVLVRPPDGAAEAGYVPDLSYLGKEFLSWLWYQNDSDAGPVHVQSGDEITVMIDRVLRLKCDFGLTGVDMLVADAPARLPEARAALAGGKQPTKAGLVLGGAAGEFRLTLDGLRLAVSSLILPEVDAATNFRARLEQRFEALTDAAHLIDALFELFLLRRTARDWDEELRRMSAWATGAPTARRRAASA